jgi:hypothetical protein
VSSAFAGGGVFETGLREGSGRAGVEVDGVILIRFPSDPSCGPCLDVDKGVLLLLGGCCDVSDAADDGSPLLDCADGDGFESLARRLLRICMGAG